MTRRDMLSGCWIPYLERAVSLKPCYEGGTNGGEVFIFFLFLFCTFYYLRFSPRIVGIKSFHLHDLTLKNLRI